MRRDAVPTFSLVKSSAIVSRSSVNVLISGWTLSFRIKSRNPSVFPSNANLRRLFDTDRIRSVTSQLIDSWRAYLLPGRCIFCNDTTFLDRIWGESRLGRMMEDSLDGIRWCSLVWTVGFPSISFCISFPEACCCWSVPTPQSLAIRSIRLYENWLGVIFSPLILRHTF